MDHILSLLSETVPKARTLEELTRPLLALLGQVTGMESTYLTTINTDEGIQRVEFARNVGSMVIPEGLVVPWADTLCKRALEEKRLYSDNVAECWGDSEAAAALGIKTYLSAPICSHDGRVLGTVCAASSAQVARSADVEPLLMLMSGLLSYSLERELLVERLQAANAELAKLALTDSLTGLSNRRAILSEFNRLFAQAQREQKYVLVAVIDLDGFKGINDTYGHQAGDTVLRRVAAGISAVVRKGMDFPCRYGGDEFAVVVTEVSTEVMENLARRIREGVVTSCKGAVDLSMGLALLEPPDTGESLVQRADRASYAAKKLDGVKVRWAE